MRFLPAFLVLLLPCLAAAVDSEPRRLGYLYVEANEGGSSGGHVAVRFDDETFHFQFEEPGVLRLHRDDSADFLFRYVLLENRGVHESWIAVSDETFGLLRDEFSRRALIESAQFAARDGLRADAALIAALASPEARAATLPLEGFGYFPASGAAIEGRSASLVDLRECVRQKLAPESIAARRAVLERRLEDLRPDAAAYDRMRLVADEYPALPPFFSTRYVDALAAAEVLRVLDDAPVLRAGTVRQTSFALSPPEQSRLRVALESAATQLCDLPVSSRPDWGAALAVGMARLAAMEASLAAGRWAVLDVHAADATTARLPEGSLRGEALAVLEDETAADFDAARAAFLSRDGFREADYSAVESAANRHLEARAARSGAPLRIQGDEPVPQLAATAPVVVPDWRRGEAEEWIRAALAARASVDARLRDLHRYDLLRRNCASEIFATFDDAFARLESVRASTARDEAVRGESIHRLGGYVDTTLNATFIPIVAQAAVSSRYRVVERRDHPSYRGRRLQRMEREEAPWRVALRESNTVTSEAYRPGLDDSSFLFFADGQPVIRPLLGAANLAFGLGNGVLGIATLPFDGSRRLVRGARGVLFSLPELVFLNLRKGTTSFVERRWGDDLR